MLSSLVPWLLSDNSVPTRAVSQLGGVFVGSTLATVVALMVVHAVTVGPRLWSRVAEIGLGVAAVTVALTWNTGVRYDRFAPSVAVVLLALATTLLRTLGFALFVLFRQRFKSRRKALLEQLRSGTNV